MVWVKLSKVTKHFQQLTVRNGDDLVVAQVELAQVCQEANFGRHTRQLVGGERELLDVGRVGELSQVPGGQEVVGQVQASELRVSEGWKVWV